MVRVISMAAIISCFLFGCGGKSPPDVCDEFSGVFVSAFARCGADAAQVREAFLKSVGGSCQDVIDIRDDDALETECIPWFDGIGCAVLASDDLGTALPGSCKAQFVHK